MTRERAQHRYSAELKQRLVAEIEAGHLSIREAARDAQTTVTLMHQWLEEYGRFKPKRDIVEVVMKSEQDKIAALEKALADAHLKLRVYDELITQANRMYKTDFKKKLWFPVADTCCGNGDHVAHVCAALGYSRDAYYKRQSRSSSDADAEQRAAALVTAQIAVVRAAQPRVGTRKLQRHLAVAGIAIGRDRLFRLLGDTGQLVRRKPRYTRTTYAQHAYAVAPNLVRGRPLTGPRQVLVSDITYLRLGGGRFVYLFLVTDLYARRIVGWHLSLDLSHHAALIALQHAIATLGDVTGVVHHSDRGTQYCCHAYQQLLRARHMLASMTDADHCYQNAVAERVNGILKDEFDLDAEFPSMHSAQQAVTHAVSIYNAVRLHSRLHYQTPDTVFANAA
ncbi:MAG: IS3 family transposase [Gemmatimonadaceae bacterium]